MHVLLVVFAPLLFAQNQGPGAPAVVQGTVRDSQGNPLAGVVLSLESKERGLLFGSASNSTGQFRFDAVPPGTYTLDAKRRGYLEKRAGPFALQQKEVKSLDLTLALAEAAVSKEQQETALPFSDEPQFTIAGVKDTTALGGHGSDRVLRNSDALSRDAASLASDNASRPDALPSSTSKPATEAAIRRQLERENTAILHFQLAELEEREGRPLEAVKEYQRAAELQPSETYLFAWGTELLTHRAYEPAIEVFAKGRRLFPRSTRMALGLGAATYAQGSKEEAKKVLLEACDLEPADPTPYLFLSQLQTTENTVTPEWTARLERFVALHPESAMAHYSYAVALAKEGQGPESSGAIEAQLQRAIEIDPKLGNAYLEWGILRLKREDFTGAIALLEKAVRYTPLPDEAHYRLAEAYRHLGEPEKARQEVELYKELSEQKNKEAARERQEIQQFVYTLRSPNLAAPPSGPDPQ